MWKNVSTLKNYSFKKHLFEKVNLKGELQNISIYGKIE